MTESVENSTNRGVELPEREEERRFVTDYKMDHKRLSLALIFNHTNFTTSHLKPRTGTEYDRDNLNDVFQGLGFEVHIHEDFEYQQIIDRINEVAKFDHTDRDCLCITILTHGGDNGLLAAKNFFYNPDSLCSRLTADNCPTLAGKPKILFLQACQGDKRDIVSVTEIDGPTEITRYRIPTQADFLFAYSTVFGYYSYRDPNKGSWFIQSLCKELGDKGFKNDLLTLLTYVSQRVATQFETYHITPATKDTPTLKYIVKQIPCIISTLTKSIQFNKKNKAI